MADPVIGPVQDNDLFKVIIRQRLYGQRLLNVLWYRVTDAGGTPPDRWAAQVSLANQVNVAGGIIPLMTACQTEDSEVTGVLVWSYRTRLDRKPYAEVAMGEPGLVASPAGDANTALSIEKRALVTIEGHPRYGIGRFQLGGIPQTGYEAGAFDPVYLIDAQALADELTDQIVAAGVTFQPVLVNTDGASFVLSDIFGAVAKDTVRVMRRRTVGVGE